MKTRKIIVASLMMVFMAAALLPAFSADKTFTLKMHHPGGPDHPYTLGAEKFKQLVEEKTNGTIKINIFPNNELASGAKAIEGVQMGTIDIALESTMSMGNFVPEMGVLDLPFLFPNREVAFKVLDGKVGKELADKSLAKGLRVLYYWDNGFRNISNSKRPINSPEDLKGLKIRVPESKVYISTFKALGAIPSPMAFSELFTALQLKTVDGQENPNGHMITYKLVEVQKYYSITNHIYTAEPLVIRNDLFSKMSKAQQEALLQAAKEAGDYERQLSADKESYYLDLIKKAGVQVNNPDLKPFQNAVKEVYDQYKDKLGKYIDQIIDETK